MGSSVTMMLSVLVSLSISQYRCDHSGVGSVNHPAAIQQPIVATILDTHNIDTARAQFTTVSAFLKFVTIGDGWRADCSSLSVAAQCVFVRAIVQLNPTGQHSLLSRGSRSEKTVGK